MGVPLLVRRHLHIETAPCSHRDGEERWVLMSLSRLSHVHVPCHGQPSSGHGCYRRIDGANSSATTVVWIQITDTLMMFRAVTKTWDEAPSGSYFFFTSISSTRLYFLRFESVGLLKKKSLKLKKRHFFNTYISLNNISLNKYAYVSIS